MKRKDKVRIDIDKSVLNIDIEKLNKMLFGGKKVFCNRCNRELTDINSMIRGYGKVCFEKRFGVKYNQLQFNFNNKKIVDK